MNPLDRKLCVLAFRRVCPWHTKGILRQRSAISQASALLSGDAALGDRGTSVSGLSLCRMTATLRRIAHDATGSGRQAPGSGSERLRVPLAAFSCLEPGA